MALERMVLLFGLVATALAQTTVMPMPSPSPSPMPEAPETTTMMMPTTTEAAPEVLNTSSARYSGSQATMTRNNHFYCLGENRTRTDFRMAATYRWGLWIQYPVLSYLDTMRKRHLFYAISQIVDNFNGGPIFDNICVAEVQQYGVSTYRESVFVKLYISGQPDTLATVQALDTQFRRNFVPSSAYTSTFRDRLAINVNSTNPSAGPNLSMRTVNDSVHPGCDSASCPEGDPTLLAVVIGTYAGQWYTMGASGEEEDVTIENLEAGITGYVEVGQFATNPRPLNYGLEPGDIVFAVFGSIFLTILAGAIVLGFCIHPFYLS